MALRATTPRHECQSRHNGSQGFSARRSPEADTHRDEMAFWMYSSGSTGRPKGIVHLQHDMAYSEPPFARNVLKLTPGDICFSVPKIFFAYGFGNFHHLPVLGGRGDAAAAGPAEAGDRSSTRSSIPVRPCSSACRRSTPR